MQEKETKEVKPIFLCDPRFVEWERPGRIQRPDMFYLDKEIWADASTELSCFIGFDVLNEGVGKYHLVASSAKYIAKVAEMGEKHWRYKSDEKTSNDPKNLILFAGSIAIYSKDKIPGTEINGVDFIRHGEIFTAREKSDILMSDKGLGHLIFEGFGNEQAVERIEEIIRGYEDQVLAERAEQSQRLTNEYIRGDMDRAEATFGTFGRSGWEF